MRIDRVTATPGSSAFFFDDQAAITAGTDRDGVAYTGDPQTPGYEQVREPGESLLVQIETSDGRVLRGDCAAVQYSGAGDRDPLFRAAEYAPRVEGAVAEALVGRDPTAFADNAAVVESLRPDGERLHTAVRYGVSQALLAAAAAARGTTRTRVLADALGTEPASEPVPVFGQSGDDPDGYDPRIHVDVYGTLGELFGPPYDRREVVDYFRELARAAAPYPLQVEGPVDAGSHEAQIHAMAELRDGLDEAGVAVDIVADEWCDTRADVERFVDAGAADVVQVKTPDLGSVAESGRAVRYCGETDVRAYLGGTCNETTVSARACAHIGLATDAAQLLAKPGMGFDEGYAVVTNEMRATLARHNNNAERRHDSAEHRYDDTERRHDSAEHRYDNAEHTTDR